MEVAAPLLFWLLLLSCSHCIISQPGFISINCGGKEEYRDDNGIVWAPDNNITFGKIAQTAGSKEYPKQYTTLRHFPADNTQKFCYKFDVKNRIRYLVRVAFLYGNFDGSNVYPKFDLYLGSTYWSTIAVFDTDTVVVRESIILTTSPTISVCLFKATTGKAFISTLELREFNGSLYTTDFENQFFLSVSARINFGAESSDPIRYPYDPYDRIWESDSLQKANYLVDKAVGTKKISTTMPIDVNLSERPPEKVMQTAVVGTEGSLTYRLNLNGFPGFGWAVSYFSEIEDLDLDETRKFRFIIPGSNSAQYSKVVVNVQENAQGKYRLYEPGYQNISFPFVLPFEFRKTNDSSRGPILNALEISKYVEISSGSQDAATMASFISRYVMEDWAQEGGDPCLPAPWSWVQCNSEPQPRIVSIKLSRKNLTENIPMELSNLTGLVELWLDQNSFVGSIPDLSNCVELKKIHLENNRLTGPLPLELFELPNISELYLQNNMLSGNIPEEFSNKKIIFNFSGNSLSHQKQNSQKNQIIIIVSSMIVVLIILIAAFSFYQCYKRRINLSSKEDGLLSNPPSQKLASFFNEVKAETSYKFTLSELEDATNKFVKQVGSGGYGVVYYGKLKDGKEIAVKVLTSDSFQGNREFSNEVSLLSRIHHRNLVAFLGYCQQNGKNILVYDFMHNGTLKEHLYGPSAQQRALSWLERLEIAEDAARGIEYLHTGCTPTIIHRDVKSSNILLEKNMRAKVSDFGLSKLAVDGSSHVSSVVRGTVGYLDPEYYISQQLTEKSDVYSFGVILLELISGQEAISNERFGVNCRNIVQWAKAHIESGYIEAVIDPALQNDFHIQSVWKIAEKAISCVQPYGSHRPTISDVLKEIQEAILIEKENEAEDEAGEDINTDMITSSMRTTVNIEDSVDTATPGRDMSLSDTVMLPVAR